MAQIVEILPHGRQRANLSIIVKTMAVDALVDVRSHVINSYGTDLIILE